MWRNAEEFEPHERGPRGGSAPELRFFVERASGKLFVGKSSVQAIMGARGVPANPEWGYVGPYEEELREALALILYGMIRGMTPTIALCSLPVAPRGDAFQDEHGQAVHVLTSVDASFTVLGPDFMTAYHAHRRASPNTPFQVQTETGERLPLIGFGALLAAGALLDDRDVVGASGSNAGFLVDEAAHVCRVVKIDGGGAFEFRINSAAGVARAARGVIYDRHQSIEFSELTVPDREEFLAVLKTAVTDWRPESGILPMLEANFVAPPIPNGDTSHALPRLYLDHINDGLVKRLSSLVASFRADLDRVILLSQEGRIAEAVVVTAAARDDELSHAQDVVAAVEELVIANAKLRGLVSRDAVSNHIEETDCSTFQLPRAPPSFVGRDDDLAALHRSLATTGQSVISQCVAGMGGIGKTTLATIFARKAANGGEVTGTQLDYGHVAWLRAEYTVELDLQCVGLAELWCGSTATGVSGSEARDMIWRKLGRGTRYSLIVFDNLPNVSDLRALLPSGETRALMQGKVHVIVTTRDTRPQTNYGSLPLAIFSQRATYEYLRARLPAIDEQSANRVHDALGGLPLAVSQAIAYMKATALSVEDFLLQFQGSERAIVLHGVLEGDTHPRTIGTLVVLALKHLTASDTATRNVLEVISFLPPDEIRKEVLVGLARCDAVDAALAKLQQFGLIAATSVTNVFSMHRLAQFCVRDNLKQSELLAVVLEDVVCGLNKALVKGGDVKAAYLSTAVHVCDIMTECAGSDEAATLAVNTAGCLCFELHQPAAALKVAAYPLRHRFDMWGPENRIHELSQAALVAVENTTVYDVTVEEVLSIISTCWLDQHRTEAFIDLMQHLLPRLEKRLGRSNPLLLTHLENLSIAYGMQGDLRRQSVYLDRAQELRCIAVSSARPTPYSKLRNWKLQVERLQRRLREVREERGKASEIAGILVNLAGAHLLQGNIEQEREALTLAIGVHDSLKDDDADDDDMRVSLAATLTLMSRVHHTCGDTKMQIDTLERALQIKSELFDDDWRVVIGLANLGRALRGRGDNARAKTLFLEAIRISNEHVANSPLAHAEMLCELAVIYGRLNDYDAQGSTLREAMSVLDKESCNAIDENGKSLTFLLAEVYQTPSDFRDAKSVFQTAYEYSRNAQGRYHYETISVLAKLLSMGLAREEYENARDEVSNFMLKYSGTDHHDVFAELAKHVSPSDGVRFMRLAVLAKCRKYTKQHPQVIATLKMLAAAHIRVLDQLYGLIVGIIEGRQLLEDDTFEQHILHSFMTKVTRASSITDDILSDVVRLLSRKTCLEFDLWARVRMCQVVLACRSKWTPDLVAFVQTTICDEIQDTVREWLATKQPLNLLVMGPGEKMKNLSLSLVPYYNTLLREFRNVLGDDALDLIPIVRELIGAGESVGTCEKLVRNVYNKEGFLGRQFAEILCLSLKSTCVARRVNLNLDPRAWANLSIALNTRSFVNVVDEMEALMQVRRATTLAASLSLDPWTRDMLMEYNEHCQRQASEVGDERVRKGFIKPVELLASLFKLYTKVVTEIPGNDAITVRDIQHLRPFFGSLPNDLNSTDTTGTIRHMRTMVIEPLRGYLATNLPEQMWITAVLNQLVEPSD